MSRIIIKLTDEKTKTDYYLEWSTVVDAPVTYGLSLGDFREYYRHEYGLSGMREFDERIARVQKAGHSAIWDENYLETILRNNRAGDREKTLTKEQIIELYCRHPAKL
jgi:hypothetical protein